MNSRLRLRKNNKPEVSQLEKELDSEVFNYKKATTRSQANPNPTKVKYNQTNESQDDDEEEEIIVV